MKKHIWFLILFSVLTISCEDVVSVDMETAAPRLVVDASINWYKNSHGESQYIRLTTTSSFYETEVPPASGAIVRVHNSRGEAFDFTEESNLSGYYICTNFKPELGETYTLEIVYKNETYTATETLYPAPDLLYTTQELGGLSGETAVIKAFFKDPAEETNFYMHRFSKKDKLPQSAVFNDAFVNGNETFTVRFFDDLPRGEEVNIELMGISEKYYDYMIKVFATVSETNAGPFEVAPAVLRGNLKNNTNPDNFAFGYFRLSQASVITHIAE